MKLLTKALETKFETKFPLYSQSEKGNDAIVIAHFFLANMDWYATEGNKEGDDFIFYGVADFHNGCGPEYGYFSLKELSQTFNVPMNINGKNFRVPMNVERDMYWKEKTIQECNIF